MRDRRPLLTAAARGSRAPATDGGHAPRAPAFSSVVAALGVLSLFVLATIAGRVAYTHTTVHVAIAWNLALAWIPFLLAVSVVHRVEQGRRGSSVIALAALWLLFLPNAPYMVTDVKYAGFSDDVPVLYDVLLLSAAAWAGLLLGLTSILLVHTVARRFLAASRAWGLVVAVLASTAFGIYLGRVRRWNSWDLFVHPASFPREVAHGLFHLRPVELTILFTAFLAVAYLVLYALASGSLAIRSGNGHALWRRDGGRRRPRLLLLITLAETGGAQAYVQMLLPTLAARFELTVAAHGDGPVRTATDRAGAEFVPLTHLRRPINPLRDMLALVELFRLCRRARPDILHASSSKAGVLGRLAGAVAGVPIRIFTVHGWAFAAYEAPRRTLYLWADRLVNRLTSRTICVAESERQLGCRIRTCDPSRTVVIHNAVEVAAFAPAPNGNTPPLVVSVGRFAYPKDHATLVHALALLRSDYRAMLVGDGPTWAAVAEDVRRRGLEGRVELPGARSDIPELLAAADLFVLSSRSEALPVSILEAMAAALPVVASDVGGVSELVTHDETGLLVRPGDPDALAAALDALLRDPERRSRLGVAARKRADEEFTPGRFREAHLAVYREELARRGLPAPYDAGARTATPLARALRQPVEARRTRRAASP